MKTYRRLSVIIATVAIFITGISFLSKSPSAEVKYQARTASILIKGTSTLHDWEMKSNEGKCEALFILGANNKLNSLTALKFNLLSKTLKSGNGMMDNNTYKALKTDAHATISFVVSSASVTQVDQFNYQIKCQGKLTIAGTTKDTELLAVGKVNPADNSLNISGTKKMKMTEYNVQPPTVMMGTIKTGDEISITYSLKLTQ
jgi:hypothetical protein